MVVAVVAFAPRRVDGDIGGDPVGVGYLAGELDG